jgi:NTE family protein
VLAGGGATARGWELGMLKGLRDAGVDLTQADLIEGTSAGAFLGVQLRSGKTVDALYPGVMPPGTGSSAAAGPPPFDEAYFQETRRLWTNASADTAERRVEIGKRGLAATRVISEEMQVRITTTALGDIHEWPGPLLTIATTDVGDGSVRFLGQRDGVPLERALAASTAQPGRVAPITIGDRRYMDGGVAGTNVDGAAGYGVIVALTPGAGPKTKQEVDTLRAQGSRVLTIAPDADSEAARGQDPLDVTRVRPSAEAGYRQAAAVLAGVRELWETSTQGH